MITLHFQFCSECAVVTSFLTFDLQADLVLGHAQDATGHTGVGALVLCSGLFDLQGAVDVSAVLTAIQPAALSILKPAHGEDTFRWVQGMKI